MATCSCRFTAGTVIGAIDVIAGEFAMGTCAGAAGADTTCATATGTGAAIGAENLHQLRRAIGAPQPQLAVSPITRPAAFRLRGPWGRRQVVRACQRMKAPDQQHRKQASAQ